jgi:FAD/FMN-containing dehydrogenase
MPSIASIISGLLAALAHGLPTNSTIQCTALSALLPNEVSYPVSVTYTSSISSYFWGQEKLAPACIFTPKSASDVSIAIATLSQIHNANAGDSLFAIRSGGHSPVSGAANGNGGVTIDMRSMNSINVSSDQSVVTVGAGTIWDQVYEKLDPMNLTVAGARVAGLGVGGFLTGGKAYHSFRHFP